MTLTSYKVKRNGREYEYVYDRSKYSNNSTEYNKQYWEDHKKDLSKKAKLRRIEKNLSKISTEHLPAGKEVIYKTEVFIDGDITEIFMS